MTKTNPARHVPREIREALEACGKPWEACHGKRHVKLKVGGILVGILPWGNPGSSMGDRGNLNVIAAIRRESRRQSS